MKKHLVIATDNFVPRWDGISRFLLESIPELKRDFKVTVLAPDFGSLNNFKKELKGVRIIRFRVSKKVYGDYRLPKPNLFTIMRVVKRADIVWTQGLGPISSFTMLFARFFGVKRVSYVHSLEWELVVESMNFKGFMRFLANIIIKTLILLVYNSSMLLMVPSFEVAHLLEGVGVKTDKVIVHMGINTKYFRPPRSKVSAKKRIGIDPEKFVIGFSGRIAREKDPITLLRAFIMLSKTRGFSKGSSKKVFLLIVGSGVRELENRFKSRRGVKLVGSVDHVVPYLQAMDVFVLPSLTETSSLATMEAMSCGVIPVVTPVGCLKNYIKEGFNGFFFEKKDYVMLVNKLKSLFFMKKNNPAEYKRIALNARRTIIKYYNINRTINEVKRVLNYL